MLAAEPTDPSAPKGPAVIAVKTVLPAFVKVLPDETLRLPVKLAAAFTVKLSAAAVLPRVVLPSTCTLLVTVRAVPAPVRLTLPWSVVVIPLCPSVIALALVVPNKSCPVVPVAVPESIEMLPELLVAPVAFPD